MKEFPPFRLDELNQCLWHAKDAVRDERVQLPPKAFDVLQFLVDRAGRLVTREEVFDFLWADTYVQPDVLKGYIADIRRALGDDPKSPRFIQTLPRRGYRFIAPVSDAAGLSALKGASAPDSKLVGREKDLAELREYLQDALQDHQQIVFVTGEAGIGKTALVEHFRQQLSAEAPGIRIASGQCIEGYGGKEAYYPMLEALGELCRGPRAESIIQLLGTHAPTWLAQFPALAKRERPEVLRREIWGATRERMLREIGEALTAISCRDPLLLIFEDLHWVDHSTVDLISALARRRTASKLMLIGTYRPVDVVLSGHPLNILKQDLLAHYLCHEIALEPLSEEEVATYLDANTARAPEGLAGLVYRHSDGNPLFMVAALEHMRERGFIINKESGWILKVSLEEIELEVPESLRQMIEIQIERLTTEQQRALEAASVTVAGFSATVNALAANLNPESFEELCEELSRRYHIVRSVGSQQFPDGSFSAQYEFVHALYREIFYRRQSPGRRAKLHRSVGERLEALFAGHLEEIASELAHHFEQGADWQRAVKYLRLVADAAGRRFAPTEAERVLHHAVEVAGKLPEIERAVNETEILEKLASMYVVAFDMRSVEAYQAIREKAAYYGLVDAEIRALIDMAYPLSWTSTQRCLEVVEQALQLSEKQADPFIRARTRASCLVRRVWAGGWNAEDADSCREALDLIRRTGDPLVSAWHTLDCNFILWCSSQYRAAQRDAVDSLAVLLREYENNLHLSVAYWLSQFTLPWSLLMSGEWGEALRVMKSGIEIGEKNGDRYRGQTLLIYQAWLYVQGLDYAGALEICESVLPSLDDISRGPWNRFCRVLAGTAESSLGNHNRALSYFQSVEEEMNRSTIIFDWYMKMLLASGLADLWLAKRDFTKARMAAERFVHFAQQTAERTWLALAFETVARVALAEDDAPRGRDSITQAISAMNGFEVPLAEWRVNGTAARVFEILGDREESRRHRDLSRATILRLADSLPVDELVRRIFLSSPVVSQILEDSRGQHE